MESKVTKALSIQFDSGSVMKLNEPYLKALILIFENMHSWIPAQMPNEIKTYHMQL